MAGVASPICKCPLLPCRTRRFAIRAPFFVKT
jgi:hypothetical protein